MTTPDPRRTLFLAAEQVADLLAGTTPDQADATTPCADWDVAALAGHLLAVVRRVTVVGAGEEWSAVPSMRTDVPPEEWAATFAAGLAELRAVWADDAVLERDCRLPFGTFPGRVAAGAYTQELTTHGWDLATATGQADRLDRELATAALAAARRMVPAEPRGGRIPFGPVVDVPADADAYLRLAGWLGREPVDVVTR